MSDPLGWMPFFEAPKLPEPPVEPDVDEEVLMGGRPSYYHRDLTPVRTRAEMLQLWRDMEDNDHPDARRVAATARGKLWVSTVFLGFDHSFNDVVPVVFETMLFGGERRGEEASRSSTEIEALATHYRFVRRHLGWRAARRFRRNPKAYEYVGKREKK